MLQNGAQDYNILDSISQCSASIKGRVWKHNE